MNLSSPAKNSKPTTESLADTQMTEKNKHVSIPFFSY
jgi:hypothetical protein